MKFLKKGVRNVSNLQWHAKYFIHSGLKLHVHVWNFMRWQSNIKLRTTPDEYGQIVVVSISPAVIKP